MRFRIHYEVGGAEDSIVIDGETIEEIRIKAGHELHKRGGINPWAEEIKAHAEGRGGKEK